MNLRRTASTRSSDPRAPQPPRVLVAGIGNIFLGDDGFGPEVTERLATEALPPGVEVTDFGVRVLHLAYEIAEGGYDTVILVDAASRGGEPGTVYLIEPDLGRGAHGFQFDGHALDVATILGLLPSLGGTRARILVVGCEPATVAEAMGLSEPVACAVDDAVRMIRDLTRQSAAGRTAEPQVQHTRSPRSGLAGARL